MGGRSGSKSQTVGYRYYLSLLMVLCHGPCDFISQVLVDKREAWKGQARHLDQIAINKENLFGGESREGGVSGNVDVMMGYSDQPKNAFLVNALGSTIPAFRGVCSVVLKNIYMGMNPYLKRWAFRVKRIYKRSDGSPQWYAAKAEVSGDAQSETIFTENFNNGLNSWTIAFDAQFFMSIDNNTLKIRSAGKQPEQEGMFKNLTQASYWNIITLKFKIDKNGDIKGNGAVFELYDQNNNLIFNFTPVRDSFVDPLARAHACFTENGQGGLILSDSELNSNVWYLLTIIYNSESGSLAGSIKNIGTNTVVKNASGISNLPTGITAKVKFRPQLILGGGGADITTWYDDLQIIQASSGDMNPAHIIRECLTDKNYGIGWNESDIDDVSFTQTADILYDEGMGISIMWDRQAQIFDFIREIVKHIDAALYIDHQTGKYVLKLIRKDYNVNNLITLDESNISKVSDFSKTAFGELTNSLSVNYWNTQSDIAASVTVQDIALIQTQGATINTTVQYPGFTNQRTATIAAQRDLKTLSTPLVSCTIYADSVAQAFSPGDVFILNWPDYEVHNMVMRITNIAYGDGRNNRVRINCTQDIFNTSPSLLITVPPTQWVDPNGPPLAVQDRIVFEVPYLEAVQQYGQTTVDNQIAGNPDIAFVGVAALRPQSNAINGRVYVDIGNGYEDSASMDFCPGAVLASNVGKTDKLFAISNLTESQNIRLGTWFQIDNELIVVDAFTDTQLTVRRGALDTVPMPHSANSKIFFWDVYGQGPTTEYVRTDQVNVKILTNTGGSQLNLSDAFEDQIIMQGRAVRPYPPANLKINGFYYPDNYQISSQAVLTWDGRDRRQQTAAIIIAEGDGNVGPETGTTYEVSVSLLNASNVLTPNWLIAGTGITRSYTFDQTQTPLPVGTVKVIFKVSSLRDGYRSYQSPELSVSVFLAPSNLTATYIPLNNPTGLTATYNALSIPTNLTAIEVP